MSASQFSDSPLLSALTSDLEEDLREELLKGMEATPTEPLTVKGSKQTTKVAPPVITTIRGLVAASQKVIVEKKVDRLPDFEVISKRVVGIEADGEGGADQYEIGVQTM